MVTFHYEERRPVIQSSSCQGGGRAKTLCSSSWVVPVRVFVFRFLCFFALWSPESEGDLLNGSSLDQSGQWPRHPGVPEVILATTSNEPNFDFYLEYATESLSLSNPHFMHLQNSPFFWEHLLNKNMFFAHHRYQILIAHALNRPDTHAIQLTS